MTVTEIVDELPRQVTRASDALRLQVLTLASTPPADSPSIFERVRRRRLLCSSRRRQGSLSRPQSRSA